MTGYPNLRELIKWHPYGEPTVCDHAGIEPELLHAALEGREALTPVEVKAIARLYGCSAGVLNHPKVIMLDMSRLKHKRMVEEVNFIYIWLKHMAGEGNVQAAKYLEWAALDAQTLMHAACNNKVSYGCYLGIKEQLAQYVRFAAPRPKRRGVTAV